VLVFVSVLKITFLAKRDGQSPRKKEMNKEMVEREREIWDSIKLSAYITREGGVA